MQKLLTLCFAMLLQSNLFAQIQKGQWIVSFSGQFQRENQDGLSPAPGGAVTYNAINEKRITTGQYTPALLYALKNRWLIGGGVDIQHVETKQNPRHKEVSSSSGGGVVFLQSTGQIRGNTFSPFLYAEYIHPIGKKFAIGLGLSPRFSLEKNVTKAGYFSRDSLTGSFTVINTNETAYRSSGCSLQLSPVFRYQLFPHFGLQLVCGGFSLSQKRDDSRYPSYEPVPPSFGLDLLPKNWTLGVYLNRS